MDMGMKKGLKREGSSGEANRAIVGLLNTHGLASLSPVPPSYKARGDIKSGGKRPRVPKIAPTSSSIRSNRHPAATWHTVGAIGGGMLSPRRPRYMSGTRYEYLPPTFEIFVGLQSRSVV